MDAYIDRAVIKEDGTTDEIENAWKYNILSPEEFNRRHPRRGRLTFAGQEVEISDGVVRCGSFEADVEFFETLVELSNLLGGTGENLNGVVEFAREHII